TIRTPPGKSTKGGKRRGKPPIMAEFRSTVRRFVSANCRRSAIDSSCLPREECLQVLLHGFPEEALADLSLDEGGRGRRRTCTQLGPSVLSGGNRGVAEHRFGVDTRQRRQTMALCTGCGRDLPEEYCTQPRVASPQCGATGRNFSVTAQSGVAVGGCASWVQTRPGIQSMAQLTDCGKITLDATGPAPRNEEDALAICHRLVQVLNSSGGKWSDPVAGDQDIDAEPMNTDGDWLQRQGVGATEATSSQRV